VGRLQGKWADLHLMSKPCSSSTCS